MGPREMKLIIAGSRHLKIEYHEIISFLEHFQLDIYDIDQIVSGGAEGVDKSGETVANIYISNKSDHLKIFPAEWEKYGNRAGPIRNYKMAAYADALFLIWDGKSSGSQHMKNAMRVLNKPVYEIILRRHNV